MPALSLQGNTHHFVSVDDERTWSHVRLNIYPDGGVARLRVYGQVQCNWDKRDPSERDRSVRGRKRRAADRMERLALRHRRIRCSPRDAA